MTEKRRATLTNREGRDRVARLRRRLAFLQKNLSNSAGGKFRDYDAAEASALEWALRQLDRFARIQRAMKRLHQLGGG